MATTHATNKRRILILGGGFGGIYTAIHLEKLLRHERDVEVTLVARENFLLFTPMLHEVAASDIELSNIVTPIRKLLRKVNFFQGEIARIDLNERRVHVRHGTDGLGFSDHAHALPYDHLVLALGSITSYHNTPGVEEFALTMKTLDDAVRLRGRLLSALEQADTECGASDRASLCTVVVAGGGFAGAETVGSVNDFVRDALPFYPNVKPSQVRMVLVHSGEVILPELGESLGRYAHKKLAASGVEIRTNARVAKVEDGVVHLNDGTKIPASTLIWTAGTAPHPHITCLECPKDKGKLKVAPTMQLEGFTNIWAVGDCAQIPNVDLPGQFHPPTAQHAIRQGRTLARNVVAALHGKPAKPFRFKTLGLLAAIGKRAGVAQILGVKVSGLPAWFFWRTIYLSKLPGLDKKVRVALDWTLDLLFSKDTVQYLSAPRTHVPKATGLAPPAAT